MATYKVIQDIEAEDKLVGPLSLRQFLYAIGACVGGYLCFLSVAKHAPFLLVIFVPITFAVGFFAFPWKGQQPTEVWALARLRFLLKPHVRIWNQSGAHEWVTVLASIAPRKSFRGSGLSPDEVQSRLKALATTIDSHGWAVKGATPADLSHTDPLIEHTTSDRLVGSIEVPASRLTHLKIHDDIQAHEDMLDSANAVSVKLDTMINKSTQDRRERLIKEVEAESQRPEPVASTTSITTKPSAAAPASGQWFVNSPAYPGAAPSQTNITIIAPGGAKVETATTAPTTEEQALAEKFKTENEANQTAYYGHMRVLQPLKTDPEDTSPAPESSTEQASIAPENASDNNINDTMTIAQAPPLDPDLQEAAVFAPASPRSSTPTSPQPAAVVTDTAVPSSTEPPQKPAKKATAPDEQNAPASVTAPTDPAILEYAVNDDLDVATIARQVNKNTRRSPKEIEIRLH